MSSYKDKLETLSAEDRELANSYFTKAYKVENMFEIVRKSLPIKDPIGNFNSDIVCILDFDKVNDKVIRIMQKVYEINHKNIFDIYITPFRKTTNMDVNNKLLQNELLIVSPKRIVSLGAEGIDPGMKLPSVEHTYWMSKERFDTFVECVGDAEKMKTPEYLKVKESFNEAMKFMIMGA
jgi:hypothetical protein